MAKYRFSLWIPLRIKFTFYIGFAALVCMALLAAICIELSILNTEKLMHDRLAQFASMRSQHIQRHINNKAYALDSTFQGTKFFNIMGNLYKGNITTDIWAGNIQSLFRDMFSTSLRSYQLLTLYDNSGNLLLSMPNPEVPYDIIRKLESDISSLLPLGISIAGQNKTEVPRNKTSEADQAATAAAAASWSPNSPDSNSESPESGWGIGHKVPINFTLTPDKVWSWLSQPVPLIDDDGMISAYSHSYTLPISNLTVTGDIQASRLLGFTTVTVDCSQYLNNSNILDFDGSLLSESTTDAEFAIIQANTHGWRKMFPNGRNTTADRSWRPFSEFPAAEAVIVLQDRASKNKGLHKPGGALTNSRTPNMKEASVGFSFVNAINQNWYVTIAMPRSTVRAGYRKLTRTLVAIAIADLAFVILCAFFFTGLTTSPLYHIYRGMQLNSASRSNAEPKTRAECQNRTPSPTLENSKGNIIRRQVSYWYNFLSQPFHFLWYRHDNNQDTRLSGMYNKSRCSDASLNSTETLVNQQKSSTVEIPRLIDDREKGTTSTQTKVQNKTQGEINDSKESERTVTDSDCVFQVPLPLTPLNRRWIVDEFDELISAYNAMVEHLNLHGAKINDEVKMRTREAQESKQLAEAANKAKTVFIMNITNELRTPMNGILGIAAVAFCEKNAPIATLRRRLKTIIGSGEILRELLQQLMNYSSQLADDEVTYSEFTLGELAESILDGHAARAVAKQIHFTVQACPQEGKYWTVGSDLGKIKVICSNLVSNSIKFSDPDKNKNDSGMKKLAKVSVEIFLRSTEGNSDSVSTSQRALNGVSLTSPSQSLVGLGLDRIYERPHAFTPQSGNSSDKSTNSPHYPGSTAILEVVITDSGVGIHKEQLKQIFEAFVPGDETLSKPFMGTGLGLAMSKIECERLGGDIIIYSQLYVGSMVVLRIPVTNVHGVEPRFSVRADFDGMQGDQKVYFTDSKRSGEVSVDTEQLHRLMEARAHSRMASIEEGTDRHRLNNSDFWSSHVDIARSYPPTTVRTRKAGKIPGNVFVSDKISSQEALMANRSSNFTMETLQMLSDLATLNALDVGCTSLIMNHSQNQTSRISSCHGRLREESIKGSQAKYSTTQSSITPQNRPQTLLSAPPPMTQLPKAPHLDYPQLRVLIADDNETICMILQRFLFKLGIERIDVVNDGSSVIAIIEQAIVSGTKYSIVFMDISMPGYDGLEATQDIRRQLGYYCPVVALTGHSDVTTTQSCLEAGIQRVLVKPVSFRTLAQTVAELAVQEQPDVNRI